MNLTALASGFREPTDASIPQGLASKLTSSQGRQGPRATGRPITLDLGVMSKFQAASRCYSIHLANVAAIWLSYYRRLRLSRRTGPCTNPGLSRSAIAVASALFRAGTTTHCDGRGFPGNGCSVTSHASVIPALTACIFRFIMAIC
jgi:hypothetical protein